MSKLEPYARGCVAHSDEQVVKGHWRVHLFEPQQVHHLGYQRHRNELVNDERLPGRRGWYVRLSWTMPSAYVSIQSASTLVVTREDHEWNDCNRTVATTRMENGGGGRY